MTVNAINGTALSAFSAVDGKALSGLSEINGQALGAPSAGAVVLLGSADIEPTNGTSAHWWTAVSGTTPTSTTPTGVHDHAWQGTSGSSVFFDFPASTLTPSAGMRFYRTVDAAETIIRFNSHIVVAYVAGGNFRVLRNATQLAISTGGHIALNTQYYIEITGFIDNSAGSFTCKLYNDSGTLLETISASGVDTLDGAGSATQVLFATTGYWEDVWVDTSGALYGRAQVETLRPDGAGDLTQLTRGGTDSGANWSQVDEKPAQIGGAGDDYVDSTGDDQFDTYTFANRSVTGTPRAVGVSAHAQRITGSPQFKFVLRIGGVTYEGTQTFTATGTNKFYGEYWNNNPATGLAWADSEINSLQAGIKWLDTQGRTRALYVAVLVQL